MLMEIDGGSGIGGSDFEEDSEVPAPKKKPAAKTAAPKKAPAKKAPAKKVAATKAPAKGRGKKAAVVRFLFYYL